MPHLPRKKMHMSPNATPATQSERGSQPTMGKRLRRHSRPRATKRAKCCRCHQAPCLPHKVSVHVTKCHACHARPRRHSRPRATKHAQEPVQCPKPQLPHKVSMHVTKCHTCHTKQASMSPSAMPPTQDRRVTANHERAARHQKPAQCRKRDAC